MVRSSLTFEAAKTLVHAFVSSRLDYCNSLLYRIGDVLLTKLQTVQNAAAHVVTGTTKFDHITPVLRQLHWLPVRQQITFKCLHGLAPSYLADVCTPVSSVVGRWQLRSANSGALVVPRIRTTIGRRGFAVADPATWNRLPVDLRTSSLSRDTFAKNSKLIYLAASALEVFSNWALYKLTYSFIYLSQFLSLLSSFNLRQHVTFPTHNHNHILDLVITFSDTFLAPSLSVSHCSQADHFAIFTKLSVAPIPLPPPTLHLFRRLHSIDIDSFLSDLKSSDLITNPLTHLDSLLPAYNILRFLHFLTNMLRSSPSSPGVTLNLHLGSHLLFVPLDLLSIMPIIFFSLSQSNSLI